MVYRGRPRRCVRARGDNRIQPGGFVGQLRRRLQPVPACGLVTWPGVRLHIRRIVLSYIFVQGIGIAAGDLLSRRTHRGGVRSVMGGGLLGGLALLIIAVASIGSGVMNDYSGSLALQTIGVRVRRPLSAVDRHRTGVCVDPLAACGGHRDAVHRRAAAHQLLDSRVRRGRRDRLALARPWPAQHQPAEEPTDRRRRRGRADRLRGRIRRGGSVHEHVD